MKIKELFESQKKLHSVAQHSIPGLLTWHDIDNDGYKALRFGMIIASSPESGDDKHQLGPMGSKFTTISYSKADEEILKAAGKKMGIKGSRQTPPKSKEHNEVGKMSPVSNWMSKNS